MSRIGVKPISVPAGVKVSIKDGVVNVEGPKGKLSMRCRPEVLVTWAESEKSIKCAIPDAAKDDRFSRACWGTTRALIRNMIDGVSKGYERSLEVVGVGWTAAVQGKKLKLTLGFASPVMLDIPDGLTVTVEKQFVKIAGPDKQRVGQFAASMRSTRKPEPYNGKGVKYVEEVIQRKQGKQFGA